MHSHEHYREAERRLAQANGKSAPYAANDIAAAHVHALLADLASKVELGPDSQRRRWKDALEGDDPEETQ